MQRKYVLACETSCDETSLALVSFGEDFSVDVLFHKTASQVEIHASFGGVVPNLAKREHQKNLPLLWESMSSYLAQEKITPDMMAVTVGPGLEPALWQGITFFSTLHKTVYPNIPLIGVNHLEGHIYSFLFHESFDPTVLDTLFPMVSLLVSGGHTILGVLSDMHSYRLLGETKDDAVGESFDKVARLLGLPYPGGPQIERCAQQGDMHAYPFPSPLLHSDDYEFSYSGLKTAVLYHLRHMSGDSTQSFSPGKQATLPKTLRCNTAASFQYAAFRPLVEKTKKAAKEYGAHSVVVSGGVSANSFLRSFMNETFEREGGHIPILFPPLSYCQDNAAMIAAAGYVGSIKGKEYPLEANGILSLSS